MLDGGTKTEQINFVRQQLFVEKPVWNRMLVDKTLPKRLHALEAVSYTHLRPKKIAVSPFSLVLAEQCIEAMPFSGSR